LTGGTLDCGGVVATVAAAMLRYVLVGRPSVLELRASDSGGGVWLHLTYPACGTGCVGAEEVASELVLIDSLATQWGHRGDEDSRVLWAVLR